MEVKQHEIDLISAIIFNVIRLMLFYTNVHVVIAKNGMLFLYYIYCEWHVGNAGLSLQFLYCNANVYTKPHVLKHVVWCKHWHALCEKCLLR